MGELDEDAVEGALDEDADETLALLADLTAATDPKLRELARRLAARLMLDLASVPARPTPGIGKLVTEKYRDAGDIDVDASLDAFEGSGRTRRVKPEELRARSWAKRDTALCLLVDRSGSMGGKPLATSAMAAAAVAVREPRDYSVLAFGRDVVVSKSQDVPRPGGEVVNAVLSLRGFGTTNLATALDVAGEQLRRSRASRKITILLSDCRANEPGDAEAFAKTLGELCIIAPDGDDEEARAFAARVGARIDVVSGPSEIPAVMARLLDRR